MDALLIKVPEAASRAKLYELIGSGRCRPSRPTAVAAFAPRTFDDSWRASRRPRPSPLG